jgi:hypothetical protein
MNGRSLAGRWSSHHLPVISAAGRSHIQPDAAAAPTWCFMVLRCSVLVLVYMGLLLVQLALILVV